MKGVLLACAASLSCLTLITVIFRMAEIQRRAMLMVLVFLATLPFFVVAHVLMPPDLGLLPSRWVEPSALIDLGFGLVVYSAAFFGGILQLYNLADRGFSLRILIDIDESRAGALTAGDLLRTYGGGRGVGWMYQKRIEGLKETGLLRVSGSTVENSDAGRRLAAVFRALQTFLRLDSGT